MPYNGQLNQSAWFNGSPLLIDLANYSGLYGRRSMHANLGILLEKDPSKCFLQHNNIHAVGSNVVGRIDVTLTYHRPLKIHLDSPPVERLDVVTYRL